MIMWSSPLNLPVLPCPACPEFLKIKVGIALLMEAERQRVLVERGAEGNLSSLAQPMTAFTLTSRI